MIRPTPVAAYAFVFLLLGLALLRREFLILSFPFLTYLALGYLRAPRRVQLRGTRTLDAHQSTEGDTLQVTLSVVNAGPALEGLHVRESIPVPLQRRSGSSEAWVRLASGEDVQLRYTLRVSRGFHRWGPVRLIATDALGISAIRLSLGRLSEIVVFPEVQRLKAIRIRPRATRMYSGMVPTRRGGPGVEFFDVGAILPGDPLHRVNWRASSRHLDLLFMNEFEQERVADIGIVVDARNRSNAVSQELTMLNASVRAAASLASAFLQDGNRVAMLVYGGHLDWTYPGYGKTQQQRILTALARCRAGESEYFDQLDQIPSRLFPPHSQIVLVSPLLKEDVGPLVRLRARGYPLLVITPDPVSLEASVFGRTTDDLLAVRIARTERSLLIRSLRRAGIRCTEWDVTQPLVPSIQPGLSRPGHGFGPSGSGYEHAQPRCLSCGGHRCLHVGALPPCI